MDIDLEIEVNNKKIKKKGTDETITRRLPSNSAEHYENLKLELSQAQEPGDSSSFSEGPAAGEIGCSFFDGNKEHNHKDEKVE